MPDIVLTTLNAAYAHAAVGLRCLYANLGTLQGRAKILEFDLTQRVVDVAERLLAEKPKIIGLGVYIWNANSCGELVALLKRIAPEVILVLGGPEVSYEHERQVIAALADYTITGEGDLIFGEICKRLLEGERLLSQIISANPPALDKIVPPYEFYTDEDIAHRNLYVESSRGCPFGCEFCLSSVEPGVRYVPLEDFFPAMQRLLDRGARGFKFLDRTFNLNAKRCEKILAFFLERYRPGMFLHFEMVPEYLPESLAKLLAKFPPGSVQLEIGIQTFNPEVAQRINRRLDAAKTGENLTWLRRHTGVHIHADLIVGLPGETLDSIAAGFDRLVALAPQEIQVGLLKRLRGTAIERHDDEFKMVFNPQPPYELLCSRDLDFPTVQRLRRFARYWDLTANRGNFPRTMRLLLGDSSPFAQFMGWSDYLHEKTGQTHALSLTRLVETLFGYLAGPRGIPEGQAARELWADYQNTGRSDRPKFLQKYLPEKTPPVPASANANLPQRQARHLRKPR